MSDSKEKYDSRNEQSFLKELDFLKELENLINRASQESASNTPDFILAQYLEGCLRNFETAIQQRETWHGRDPRPSHVRYGVVIEDKN